MRIVTKLRHRSQTTGSATPRKPAYETEMLGQETHMRATRHRPLGPNPYEMVLAEPFEPRNNHAEQDEPYAELLGPHHQRNVPVASLRLNRSTLARLGGANEFEFEVAVSPPWIAGPAETATMAKAPLTECLDYESWGTVSGRIAPL